LSDERGEIGGVCFDGNTNHLAKNFKLIILLKTLIKIIYND